MFTLQTQQVLKKKKQDSVSQQKMVVVAIWLKTFLCMKNEAGHRALSKTLAVDLLVTVRNPAVCVDATFVHLLHFGL